MNKTLLLLLLSFALHTSITAQDINSQDPKSGSLSLIGQKTSTDIAFESVPVIAGKIGTTKKITGVIKNEGSETLHSLSITATDGNKEWKESFTNLNIAPNTSASFEMTEPILLEKGNKNVVLTLTEPNGNVDQDLSNNKIELNLRGVDLLRPVVVEEATGTWCGWCPRGAVFMDKMQDLYPDHFVGIAVHNGDPMVVEAYDGGLNAAAFPGARVNRDTFLNPANMEAQFLDMAAIAPTATISATAIYDKVTRVLTVTAQSTTSKNEIFPKFFAALVEDGVTGEGSDWDQSNYYAGGGSGQMGGYESLPNPVPASQMVYDHVGRALLGGFSGVVNSIPTPWKTGATVDYKFDEYTIPAEFNIANMHAVVGVINASNRFINVMEVELQEAVYTNDIHNSNAISVSPNPCANVTYANMNIQGKEDVVTMNVYNSLGSLVATKDFGRLTGLQSLPFNTSNLTNGLYYAQVIVGNQAVTKQLIVIK